MPHDQNYLELFLESITTLPGRVKRNLEHIKFLDRTYIDVIGDLIKEQDEYIKKSGEKILSIPVTTTPLKAGTQQYGKFEYMCHNFWNDPREGMIVKNSIGKNILIVPTTEELKEIIKNDSSLAKISNYRYEAGKLASEKIATAEQTYAYIDSALKRLDADLEKFGCLLKDIGQFGMAEIGEPLDALAAIQVSPKSPDWILAKVISYDFKTGIYNLSDEDFASNKIFTLPESQVVILGGEDMLACGDVIYSVYPDTTSFYQATVVQSPRKLPGGESFVMVNFKDDSDENGVTHDKSVLMKHVMRVPFGEIK